MKVSSEEHAALASRIIAAESLSGVAAFELAELQSAAARPLRRLTSRDLANDVARAAYALGRQRGWQQGVTEGLAQGRQRAAQEQTAQAAAVGGELAAHMQPLLAQLQSGLAELEARVAGELVELAVELARQVLRREPGSDPQGLLPAVREALHGLAEGASQIVLHVHPVDAVLLNDHLEDARAGRCRVLADPALPRGSCRVEADTGVADAGFAARWRSALAALGRDGEPQP